MIVLATSYQEARSLLLSTLHAIPVEGGEASFFDRVVGVGPERIDTSGMGILSYHIRGNGDRPLEVRNVLTVEGTILIYCPDGLSRAPAFALALHAREALREGARSLQAAAETAVERAVTCCPHNSAPHERIVALADEQLRFYGELVRAARGWM